MWKNKIGTVRFWNFFYGNPLGGAAGLSMNEKDVD